MKLYITSKRVIVTYGSQKSRGALVLSPLLGRHSEDLEEPQDACDKEIVKSNLQKLSPGVTLSSYKDNFAPEYEELVSVELRESSGTASITILIREDKFQFSLDTDFREVAELLSPSLGAKLVT